MRHLLSKGASPNTSDDEVLLQTAPKSAYTQCRQQENQMRAVECGSLLYPQAYVY